MNQSDEGFNCKFCGKFFNLKGNLKKHVATVHDGVRNFMCPICNKSFTQNHSLRRQGHIIIPKRYFHKLPSKLLFFNHIKIKWGLDSAKNH